MPKCDQHGLILSLLNMPSRAQEFTETEMTLRATNKAYGIPEASFTDNKHTVIRIVPNRLEIIIRLADEYGVRIFRMAFQKTIQRLTSAFLIHHVLVHFLGAGQDKTCEQRGQSAVQSCPKDLLYPCALE